MNRNKTGTVLMNPACFKTSLKGNWFDLMSVFNAIKLLEVGGIDSECLFYCLFHSCALYLMIQHNYNLL